MVPAERLESLVTDERLLRWLRAAGVDLTVRDQLLDTAAVGLSVILWRNTALEDIHAGRERYDAVHAREEAGASGEDVEQMFAEAKAAARAQRADLDAGLETYADVADDRERARLALLIDQRRCGAGIPDDVMMRINVSTARQVRAVLDEQLPQSAAEPGGVLPYTRGGVPDFLFGVYAAVIDPDRPMTVGPAVITVGALLGERGTDEFRSSVLEKMGPLLAGADQLGARRLLWLVTLTGAGYAGGWWPSPAWPAAVADLRKALVAGEIERVMHQGSGDRWSPIPDDEAFWSALAHNPEALNGRQAHWVIGSRLRDRIREHRLSLAAGLGASESDRFSSFPPLI